MMNAGQSAHFTKHVTAAPEEAALMRREFTSWLSSNLTLDPTKASDVVLAVNEALANAAEFAYVDAPSPGVMGLRAEYDSDAAVLTVTVTDEGTWRINQTDHKNPARGRGIPLMRALTDRAVIESNHAGTEVRLQWDHVDQNCGSRTT
ncbi:anti-sigma regulatory factor [Mycolicibacterium conceptionense]|jgi:anti-sigma regulatory factor (Ser/Thr protein kinase)|uniref:Anti-sigma regulatory factor n=3 Tax=Mycolicibacterium TaxID=1866885 RepID=A0ABR5FZ89_9MYCO|nr:MULTISPECIES: ATP-binding protein [Mycolicibacterium]KLI09977.1 anti-sigma regulatory factor [Mycolicibacterium senegalense]KLO53276.1 anti-sigma regulatory factor [Mycolicibacterium senegalense]KMV18900.1 anti-sigma regulatory factor [Mycolicibacterium conceptionense]OBK00077.1 anti-sigma regulatory factor [Mycolicibacterium conceptionense]OMB77839.1 anti-sigma regulatory factor [Mycolicibacterium conceptionense]